MEEPNFRLQIENLISKVPPGKITTYGDLAALASKPLAARIVGGIAHYGNSSLPWHRLVGHSGRLAAGFSGGREVQSQLLQNEGVKFTNGFVDNFMEIRWRPSPWLL